MSTEGASLESLALLLQTEIGTVSKDRFDQVLGSGVFRALVHPKAVWDAPALCGALELFDKAQPEGKMPPAMAILLFERLIKQERMSLQRLDDMLQKHLLRILFDPRAALHNVSSAKVAFRLIDPVDGEWYSRVGPLQVPHKDPDWEIADGIDKLSFRFARRVPDSLPDDWPVAVVTMVRLGKPEDDPGYEKAGTGKISMSCAESCSLNTRRDIGGWGPGGVADLIAFGRNHPTLIRGNIIGFGDAQFKHNGYPVVPALALDSKTGKRRLFLMNKTHPDFKELLLPGKGTYWLQVRVDEGGQDQIISR